MFASAVVNALLLALASAQTANIPKCISDCVTQSFECCKSAHPTSERCTAFNACNVPFTITTSDVPSCVDPLRSSCPELCQDNTIIANPIDEGNLILCNFPLSK